MSEHLDLEETEKKLLSYINAGSEAYTNTNRILKLSHLRKQAKKNKKYKKKYKAYMKLYQKILVKAISLRDDNLTCFICQVLNLDRISICQLQQMIEISKSKHDIFYLVSFFNIMSSNIMVNQDLIDTVYKIFYYLLLAGMNSRIIDPHIYTELVLIAESLGQGDVINKIIHLNRFELVKDFENDHRCKIIANLMQRKVLPLVNSRFNIMSALTSKILYIFIDNPGVYKYFRLEDVYSLIKYDYSILAVNYINIVMLNKEINDTARMAIVSSILMDVIKLDSVYAHTFIHFIRTILDSDQEQYAVLRRILKKVLHKDMWIANDVALTTIVVSGNYKTLVYGMTIKHEPLLIPVNHKHKMRILLNIAIKRANYDMIKALIDASTGSFVYTNEYLEELEEDLGMNIVEYIMCNSRTDLRILELLLADDKLKTAKRLGLTAPFISTEEVIYLVEEVGFPVSPEVLDYYAEATCTDHFVTKKSYQYLFTKSSKQIV